MRNRIINITCLLAGILLFFSICTIAQVAKEKVSLKKLWETPGSLTTCESVCCDPAGQILYVSCINGNPTDKDGNGFIAKLSSSGDIITIKWIDGLDAPKGMGIYLKRLFVTDIDKIVEIDIDKSAVVKEYPVEGAKFLNDIAIDSEGDVYISDMATGKIHRLTKGHLETWLENENISSPNGLFYEEGEILIGTKNGIFSTNIEDKRTWQIIAKTGSIDGLEADGRGSYIISDWMGKIQLVNSNQDPIILSNTSDLRINAADIEYFSGTKTLYVPTFSDNRVIAYELIYK
jgi:hypothetical protein